MNVARSAAAHDRLLSAATLAGLAATTLSYGAGVWALADVPVSQAAWGALYVVCVAGVLLARACDGRSANATAWICIAGQAALLALIFFGADAALDALHGAGRNRHTVAADLYGLELWFVLCPGAVSVALGAACAAWVAPRITPAGSAAGRTPRPRRRPESRRP